MSTMTSVLNINTPITPILPRNSSANGKQQNVIGTLPLPNASVIYVPPGSTFLSPGRQPQFNTPIKLSNNNNLSKIQVFFYFYKLSIIP